MTLPALALLQQPQHSEREVITSQLGQLLVHVVGDSHLGRLLQGSLQLLISLLLHGLRVLQLLDQLHLQLFHLHHFFLLLLAQVFFVVDTGVVVLLDLGDATIAVFIDLHLG